MSQQKRPEGKLSDTLPSFFLGCAAFSGQINSNPDDLPVKEIIGRALQLGFLGFDTSPYYGDSEVLLGKALLSLEQDGVYDRSSCILMTKAGRVKSDEFDYSQVGIRASVERSLKRLHTDYLDIVFCHDVEFVSVEEVVEAVCCLFELKEEGKVLHVGISGYPLETLVRLVILLKDRIGKPVDVIQSYAQFTLQNSKLQHHLPALYGLGIDAVFTGSPLGMGLLRKNGVPIAALGDWHPAPAELRLAAKEAADWIEAKGDDLASLAVRYVASEWKRVNADFPGQGAVILGGASNIGELEENLKSIQRVLEVDANFRKTSIVESQLAEDEKLVEGVRNILGKWVDYSWESPSKDWVRKIT